MSRPSWWSSTSLEASRDRLSPRPGRAPALDRRSGWSGLPDGARDDAGVVVIEGPTTETAAERITRELAEGVERFIAEASDEAAATALLATRTEALIRALNEQQDA